MNIELRIDDLADGAVLQLLNLHLLEMQKYSPAESVHALDTESLKDPNITFWSARVNGLLAGCGALKEIDQSCGEIKSMKTNRQFLRMGIAAKLLDEIISEAKRRSYADIKLETGSHSAFDPAMALYKKLGFVECGPFGDYRADPYSKYYAKNLK